MPKKGARQMREQGLEKTDNEMEFTSWPVVAMINQKNYYTEYLKRDDQILVYRLQNEENRNRMAKAARDKDRALAQSAHDGVPTPDMEIDADENAIGEDGTALNSTTGGSKIVVIHPGSQNLRIGLASDAIPKTIPMVVARRSEENESEGAGCLPTPIRQNGEDGEPAEPQQLFGEDFYATYAAMTADIKTRMRKKGRRIVPNCKEVAISFNRKAVPTTLSEHNDYSRVEWTEPVPADAKSNIAPHYYTGQAALRIPDDSKPRYKLSWPIKHGYFNEAEYQSSEDIRRDFSLIIEEAIKNQLGLPRMKEWSQYGCVFVIPDLYDRNYVNYVLDLILREFGFGRVCFMQESLSGSYGAGYPSCVMVDVGAQKTSICCVDEGMCIEASRVNLRYGGYDITEAFMKMMLVDQFPYTDINLRRRYDFLLAEELKQKFCTLSIQDFSAQQYEFYVRIFGQPTQNYVFKAYDEVILAPMAFFKAELLDISNKANGRRKLIARSCDLYDGTPNDPQSLAQAQILSLSPTVDDAETQLNGDIDMTDAPAPDIARPTPTKPNGRPADNEGTPKPNNDSPAPEEQGTPQPGGAGANATDKETLTTGASQTLKSLLHAASVRDRTVPLIPLHHAIQISIEHAAKGDDRKTRDFFGGILPIGGGSQIPFFKQFLEEELADTQTRFRKDIMVAPPPREMDPQVLVWKGASVFGKLGHNDSWISGLEYDRQGSRTLAYKCLGETAI